MFPQTYFLWSWPILRFWEISSNQKKVWSRQHTFHQIARICLICHYRCACFLVRPCRNRRVAIDRDKESFLSSFECYFCSCSHHNLRLIRNLHPCSMSMLISSFNFLFPLAFLVWPICPMLCFQHLRGSPSAEPGHNAGLVSIDTYQPCHAGSKFDFVVACQFLHFVGRVPKLRLASLMKLARL